MYVWRLDESSVTIYHLSLPSQEKKELAEKWQCAGESKRNCQTFVDSKYTSDKGRI